MTSDKDFDIEISNIRRYGKAKAVLMVTSVDHARNLQKATSRANIGGKFI